MADLGHLLARLARAGLPAAQQPLPVPAVLAHGERPLAAARRRGAATSFLAVAALRFFVGAGLVRQGGRDRLGAGRPPARGAPAARTGPGRRCSAIGPVGCCRSSRWSRCSSCRPSVAASAATAPSSAAQLGLVGQVDVDVRAADRPRAAGARRRAGRSGRARARCGVRQPRRPESSPARSSTSASPRTRACADGMVDSARGGARSADRPAPRPGRGRAPRCLRRVRGVGHVDPVGASADSATAASFDADRAADTGRIH